MKADETLELQFPTRIGEEALLCGVRGKCAPKLKFSNHDRYPQECSSLKPEARGKLKSRARL